jgi:hypothetical protein
MAEWQNGRIAEWRNGGMAEWWNGGMVEWQSGIMYVQNSMEKRYGKYTDASLAKPLLACYNLVKQKQKYNSDLPRPAKL